MAKLVLILFFEFYVTCAMHRTLAVTCIVVVEIHKLVFKDY